MNKLHAVMLVGALFALTTCTQPQTEGPVRLKFSLGHPKNRQILATAAAFPCYALLITGPGIGTLDTGGGIPSLTNNYCTYPGISTPFVAGGANTTLEVLVPAGGARRIQVVGVEYFTATQCPTSTAAEFLRDANRGDARTSTYAGLYELGYAVKDLFVDSEVTISGSTYSPTKNLRGCRAGNIAPGGSPGDALAIYPNANFMLETGGVYDFRARGGMPTYIFSIDAVGIAAGGSITPEGRFTAPPTPPLPAAAVSTVVTVTDGNGYTDSVTVTSFKPSTQPLFWFSANSYRMADQAPITSRWVNHSSIPYPTGSLDLSPDPGVGSLQFIRDGIDDNGAHNMPVVRLSGGARFKNVPTNFNGGSLVDGVSAIVVAKVKDASSATLLCLSTGTSCVTGSASISMKGVVSGSSGTLYGLASESASSVGASQAFTFSDAFSIFEQAGTTATSSSMAVTVDGVASSPGSFGSSLKFTVTNGNFYVGPSTGVLNADIAEVVFYPTSQLGNTNAADFVTYMRSKYGL